MWRSQVKCGRTKLEEIEILKSEGVLRGDKMPKSNENQKQRIRIKDLPPLERPREKLLAYGADKLSDAELIAILIGSGTRDKSALDIAEEVLDKFGGFRGMAGRDMDEFKEIKGLKEAKILNLAAAFEIATRIVEEVLKDARIL